VVVLLPLPAGGSRGAAAPRACASTSAPPAPGEPAAPPAPAPPARAAHHRTPGHDAAAEHTAGPTDRDDTTGHDAGHTPPRTPHPDRAPAHAARPTKHPAHRHRDRTGRPDHNPPPTHRTRPQRHEHPKHASHRHARTHHHARPSATPRHDTTRPPPAPPSQATTEPSRGRGDGTRATPLLRRGFRAGCSEHPARPPPAASNRRGPRPGPPASARLHAARLGGDGGTAQLGDGEMAGTHRHPTVTASQFTQPRESARRRYRHRTAGTVSQMSNEAAEAEILKARTEPGDRQSFPVYAAPSERTSKIPVQYGRNRQPNVKRGRRGRDPQSAHRTWVNCEPA